MRCAVAILSLVIAACSGSGTTTTEPLIATTQPPVTGIDTSTTTSSTTSAPDTTASPLIATGCETFDAATLTDLSPVTNPLALLENTSTSTRLVCNFVGVSDGLDTGIRVEIELVSDQPDGHYTTAGEFESELELAGKPGVGSGRGNVRLQLDDETGMTLAVTIRSLSADATIPRDGEFLEIRDAIAEYLVSELG